MKGVIEYAKKEFEDAKNSNTFAGKMIDGAVILFLGIPYYISDNVPVLHSLREYVFDRI